MIVGAGFELVGRGVLCCLHDRPRGSERGGIHMSGAIWQW